MQQQVGALPFGIEEAEVHAGVKEAPGDLGRDVGVNVGGRLAGDGTQSEDGAPGAKSCQGVWGCGQRGVVSGVRRARWGAGYTLYGTLETPSMLSVHFLSPCRARVPRTLCTLYQPLCFFFFNYFPRAVPGSLGCHGGALKELGGDIKRRAWPTASSASRPTATAGVEMASGKDGPADAEEIGDSGASVMTWSGDGGLWKEGAGV